LHDPEHVVEEPLAVVGHAGVDHHGLLTPDHHGVERHHHGSGALAAVVVDHEGVGSDLRGGLVGLGGDSGVGHGISSWLFGGGTVPCAACRTLRTRLEPTVLQAPCKEVARGPGENGGVPTTTEERPPWRSDSDCPRSARSPVPTPCAPWQWPPSAP